MTWNLSWWVAQNKHCVSRILLKWVGSHQMAPFPSIKINAALLLGRDPLNTDLQKWGELQLEPLPTEKLPFKYNFPLPHSV